MICFSRSGALKVWVFRGEFPGWERAENNESTTIYGHSEGVHCQSVGFLSKIWSKAEKTVQTAVLLPRHHWCDSWPLKCQYYPKRDLCTP